MSHFPPGYWTTACVTADPDSYSGSTSWIPIANGTTGPKMFVADAVYLIKLSAELRTSLFATDARVRIYDVTAAAAVVSAHTDQTVTDEWRHVERPVSPGAGLREYRLEMKIDNGAQTVTIPNSYITILRIE
jgi:hypothetical protein